jgi:hypothetical protein
MRGVMLGMERDGLIRLPACRQRTGHSGQPWTERTEAGEPGEPIERNVSEFGPLTITPVGTTRESRLFNELIHRYHYLGYKRQGGAQMRYLARLGDGRVIACLGLSVSAWKCRPRDSFIGWCGEQREQRLHLVVNNSRFLILPWVRVRHLASKLLGQLARQVGRDWQRRYGYRPALLETFVDRSRFRGTCYRAANWVDVGDTTGRGRYDTRHEAHGASVKGIFLYPLTLRFRDELTR